MAVDLRTSIPRIDTKSIPDKVTRDAVEKIIGYLQDLQKDILNEDSSKIAYRSIRGPEVADNAVLTRAVAPNQIFRAETNWGVPNTLTAAAHAYGVWMRVHTFGPTFHDREFLLLQAHISLEVTTLVTSGVIYYFRWVSFRIVESGVSTAGTGTTITDTAKAWTGSQHNGRWMRIRPGAGDGYDHANVDNEEWRFITNTAATVLTVSRGNDFPIASTRTSFWRTPGAGVAYDIMEAVAGPPIGILASGASGVRTRIHVPLIAPIDNTEVPWYAQLQMLVSPNGATSDDNTVELRRKDMLVGEPAR